MAIARLDTEDSARQRGKHSGRHTFASNITHHNTELIFIEGDKVIEVTANFGSWQRGHSKFHAGDLGQEEVEGSTQSWYEEEGRALDVYF